MSYNNYLNLHCPLKYLKNSNLVEKKKTRRIIKVLKTLGKFKHC